MSNLSYCYFPTTVMFIDDSRPFLENMSLKLDRNLIYKLHDQPLVALQALNAMRSVNNLSASLFKQLSEDETDGDQAGHYLIDIDLSCISQQLYDAKRFSYVSVVVVDYSMPQLDGLEFCRRITDPAIKKIMLTGEADHRIAVNAFNEGLIDKFIIKDSMHMMNELNSAIQQFQYEYFSDLSLPVIKAVTQKTLSPLVDYNFINFFKKLCEEKNITEFYLLDSMGSFLLLTMDAKPTWLLVKAEQEMQEYYDVAVGNHAPQEIITALQKRERLPFFLTTQDYQVPVNQWQSFLHLAQPLLLAKGNYYYSVVEGKISNNFVLDEVMSSKRYLADSVA